MEPRVKPAHQQPPHHPIQSEKGMAQAVRGIQTRKRKRIWGWQMGRTCSQAYLHHALEIIFSHCLIISIFFFLGYIMVRPVTSQPKYEAAPSKRLLSLGAVCFGARLGINR